MIKRLLNNLKNIGVNIRKDNDFHVSKSFLFGFLWCNDAKNTSILNAIAEYITNTKMFDFPLTLWRVTETSQSWKTIYIATFNNGP